MIASILAWIIIIFSIATLFVTWRDHKHLFKRFWLIAIGVMIFEFSTQLFWFNSNLPSFMTLGPNLSWVITLGWTLIIFYSSYFTRNIESTVKKYFSTLGIAFLISIIAEHFVIIFGIRSYADFIQQTLSGSTILFLKTPIEALYYIPAFLGLILGFAGYFESTMRETLPKTTVKKEPKGITKKRVRKGGKK